MGWENEVKEIVSRKEMAKQLGGPESVARHHKAGKLTVRERIDQVLDSGSFQEIGASPGRPNTTNRETWSNSHRPTSSSERVESTNGGW